MHNYSTSEQIVGTWVDGKTLYEKTINIPASSFSSATADASGTYRAYANHGLSDFTITKIEGVTYGNITRTMPSCYGSTNADSTWNLGIGIDSTRIVIEMGVNIKNSVATKNTYGAYVTLQYTKN